MAKIDPPWRLDPLKNIIEVGWGASRYITIEIKVRYSWGSPAVAGYLGLIKTVTRPPKQPPNITTMDWTYPPLSTPMTNKRPKTTTNVPLDPITLLTIKAYYSWGTSTVIPPGVDVGAQIDAKAGAALSDDQNITVELPGTLPPKTGEPITYHDFVVNTTINFPDGTTGGGSAFYQHLTTDEYNATLAGYEAAAAHGTISGYSVADHVTYDEGGGSSKFSMLREMKVRMHKFQIPPNSPPGTTPEDVDISDEIEGQKDFTETATSDSPRGVKRFLLEYKTKTKKLKITAT